MPDVYVHIEDSAFDLFLIWLNLGNCFNVANTQSDNECKLTDNQTNSQTRRATQIIPSITHTNTFTNTHTRIHTYKRNNYTNETQTHKAHMNDKPVQSTYVHPIKQSQRRHNDNRHESYEYTYRQTWTKTSKQTSCESYETMNCSSLELSPGNMQISPCGEDGWALFDGTVPVITCASSSTDPNLWSDKRAPRYVIV
jgi:hypothetical protein